MTARLRFFLLLFLAAIPLHGQSPEPRLSFEVAVIKPNTTGSGDHSSNSGKDEIVITNWPLRRFIMRAYNVQAKQVSGPDTLDHLFFDMHAKYAPEIKRDDRPLMFRTMLEERFAFTFHRDSKEMNVYALAAAKDGLKLKPDETCTGGGSDSDGGGDNIRTLRVTCISMADLATVLGNILDDVAVDRTAAPGRYSFEIRYTLGDQGSSPDRENVPSLFTAIEETAGLHLQKQKVPVPMIVVDHIATVPTEN